MRIAPLLSSLMLLAGCGTPAGAPDAQPTASTGVALPAAGGADAVRTAKPGTAPAPGATPTATPSPVASTTP